MFRIYRHEKLNELLADIKCLMPRYEQVQTNLLYHQRFLSRQKHMIFSIINQFDYHSGICTTKRTYNIELDHYIPRATAVDFIFQEVQMNPIIGGEELQLLLRKYCSVVAIDIDEHKKVTSFIKKNIDYSNYQVYEQLGINLVGLKEYMVEQNKIGKIKIPLDDEVKLRDASYY